MAYRILVVDNQPLMLEFMQTLLEKDGHSVQLADGGLEAIQKAKTFLPEIVFVDMIMPHIDGNRLCRILRKNDSLKSTLFVVISGIAAESGPSYFGDIADVYIAKGPFIKMSVHVLKVISKFMGGNLKDVQDRILGINEIYHREITKELLFSHKHLEIMLSSMNDAVVEFLDDFRIVYANASAEKILQLPEIDLLSRDIREFIPEEFLPSIVQFTNNLASDSVLLGDELPLIINGRFIHLSLQAVVESPNRSILSIFRDVSKYKIAEDKILESLKLKDTLLKEIHHRIRNNLNLIGGLLNLQKAKINNPDYNIYIDEIKGRIQSIELIHAKLYKSDDFKVVEVGSYLYDLAVMIIKTLTANDYGVEIKLKGPRIKVPVQQAIPLGLITSELVTNAVKYGFMDPQNNQYLKGSVPTLIIELIDIDKITVKVTNNGYPFPKEVNTNSSDSLGLCLINDLVNQLGGTYDFSVPEKSGTEFSLTFPKTE